MRTFIFYSTIILVTLVMISCAPKTGVHRLDAIDRPPNTGNLDIYSNAGEVTRPYKTIAILNTTTQKRMRKGKGGLEDTIFEEAKEIGADGVIIIEQTPRTQTNSDGMGGSMSYTVFYVRAEAIVYQ